jgi:hypothetical protein
MPTTTPSSSIRRFVHTMRAAQHRTSKEWSPARLQVNEAETRSNPGPGHDDFAAGVRSRPTVYAHGHFATGLARAAAAGPAGDFATGLRSNHAAPSVAGDFATGQRTSDPSRHRRHERAAADDREQREQLRSSRAA